MLGVSCGDYRRHGAFAEYVAVPSRILYKLPDSLPFERAALLEAVSIAVHAVSRHVPKPDDTVVVVGAGMIGLLFDSGTQGQRQHGTSLPSMSTRRSWRSHNAWEPRAR